MKLITTPLLLFILAMVLVGIGVVTVYSASAQFGVLVKQLIFVAAGLAALLVCYAIDYQYFRRSALWLMLASLVLCLLVFVPGIGVAAKGAHRWIGHGGFRLQPSEFAKLGLVIYMAKMLADRRQYLRSFFSGLLPAALITGLFGFIIVIEPDFGAAFVLCVVIFGMWLAAEMRWFHLIALVFPMIPAAVAAFLSEPYRIKRLLAFLFRDKDTLMGAGYQLYQSLIAVGSGGMWGLGLGESRQKFHYLTEAHTDFIFAIMGEEYGFVRVACIVLIYAALVMIGWWVALRSTDLFGSLLAAGITLMIFTNASIHMAVVLGMLPTKGLVLPFISAGGSSLIACMAAIGLLMNIARNQYSHAQHGRGEEE
jgi:cell division protein FtsW